MTMTNLIINKKDRFSVLSSNIQSINSRCNELEAFVEELGKNNVKFSVIKKLCLQETWKSDCDDLSVGVYIICMVMNVWHKVNIAATK